MHGLVSASDHVVHSPLASQTQSRPLMNEHLSESNESMQYGRTWHLAESNFKKSVYMDDDDDLIANDAYDDDEETATCSLADRPLVPAEEVARRIKALDDIVTNVGSNAQACPQRAAPRRLIPSALPPSPFPLLSH